MGIYLIFSSKQDEAKFIDALKDEQIKKNLVTKVPEGTTADNTSRVRAAAALFGNMLGRRGEDKSADALILKDEHSLRVEVKDGPNVATSIMELVAKLNKAGINLKHLTCDVAGSSPKNTDDIIGAFNLVKDSFLKQPKAQTSLASDKTAPLSAPSSNKLEEVASRTASPVQPEVQSIVTPEKPAVLSNEMNENRFKERALPPVPGEKPAYVSRPLPAVPEMKEPDKVADMIASRPVQSHKRHSTRIPTKIAGLEEVNSDAMPPQKPLPFLEGIKNKSRMSKIDESETLENETTIEASAQPKKPLPFLEGIKNKSRMPKIDESETLENKSVTEAGTKPLVVPPPKKAVVEQPKEVKSDFIKKDGKWVRVEDKPAPTAPVELIAPETTVQRTPAEMRAYMEAKGLGGGSQIPKVPTSSKPSAEKSTIVPVGIPMQKPVAKPEDNTNNFRKDVNGKWVQIKVDKPAPEAPVELIAPETTVQRTPAEMRALLTAKGLGGLVKMPQAPSSKPSTEKMMPAETASKPASEATQAPPVTQRAQNPFLAELKALKKASDDSDDKLKPPSK